MVSKQRGANGSCPQRCEASRSPLKALWLASLLISPQLKYVVIESSPTARPTSCAVGNIYRQVARSLGQRGATFATPLCALYALCMIASTMRMARSCTHSKYQNIMCVGGVHQG